MRQSTTTSVTVGQTTSTWQNVREIVENYYSSTFVPNPTAGHMAYLAHGSLKEHVKKRKRKRRQRQERR